VLTWLMVAVVSSLLLLLSMCSGLDGSSLISRKEDSTP